MDGEDSEIPWKLDETNIRLIDDSTENSFMSSELCMDDIKGTTSWKNHLQIKKKEVNFTEAVKEKSESHPSLLTLNDIEEKKPPVDENIMRYRI